MRIEMGNGFYILIWDGYGCGLTMINPRLLTKGLDIYNNPLNWFTPNTEEEEDAIIKIAISSATHYKIIK